jgi:hypothetical protein
MSLAAIASVSSLVSAAAVLVSVVYLSLQVRQAERNQRAAVIQTILDRHMGFAQWIRQPPMADLHFRAVSGEVEFTDPEIMQLLGLVQALTAQGLDAWVQKRARLIDEPTFVTVIAAVRLLLSIPAYRAVWPLANRTFDGEFGAFVEKEILSVPLIEPAQNLRLYRQSLQGLLAAAR